MAGDSKNEGGTSLNLSIGKEVDAAFGDVIRGLLKRPAEEVGNLLADSIGIIGDRVRRKRQSNLQHGLEEVRKKLESDGVDIEDITPPDEEELHLLVNGLSLSGDESLRDMWAGLFAKALEPKSGVSAERPFISVLQSLSPADAKIIDFLAFVVKSDEEFHKKFENFHPKDFRGIAPEEKDRMSEVQKKNIDLREKTVLAISEKASVYGLDTIADESWSENLMRQGLIERVHSRGPNMSISSLARVDFGPLDAQGVEDKLREISKYIEYIDMYTKLQSSLPEKLFSKAADGLMLNLDVRLSGFGRRLAVACGLL